MSRIITEIAGFAPCLKMLSFGQMSHCEIPLSHASKGTLQDWAAGRTCPRVTQMGAICSHLAHWVWLERTQAAKLKD